MKKKVSFKRREVFKRFKYWCKKSKLKTSTDMYRINHFCLDGRGHYWRFYEYEGYLIIDISVPYDDFDRWSVGRLHQWRVPLEKLKNKEFWNEKEFVEFIKFYSKKDDGTTDCLDDIESLFKGLSKYLMNNYKIGEDYDLYKCLLSRKK